MALQFNPPEWLIRDYFSRKHPLELANEGVQNTIKTMMALDAQQREESLKKAGLSKDYASAVSDLGPEQAGQIYNPVFKQMGMTSPYILALPPADNSSLMEEFQSDPLAFQQKYGQKRADKLRLALQTSQSLEANRPVTPEEYSSLQTGLPKDIAKAYPNGIPRQLASAALMAQSRNVQIRTDPVEGGLVRVPVTGPPGKIDIPGRNLSSLQAKLSPNEYKDWQKEVNDFDTDAVVKAERVGLATMDNIDREIAKYNPALTGPLGSQQARAIAREVGTLNEGDVRRQVPDPSVLGRFKRAVTVAATGELPPDQLALIKEVVSIVREGSRSRLETVARERAQRKSEEYGGKITPDELLKSLRLPTVFSQAPQGSSGGLSEEKQRRLEELRAKKAEGTLR